MYGIQTSFNLLSRNRIEITEDLSKWLQLGEKYGISYREIGLIDFNRTGVCLAKDEVRVGFRVRFNGNPFYPNTDSWYALPVRSAHDSNFCILENKLFFNGHKIGEVRDLVLDTCNTSYQRGPHLLNLNSRSRSNCFGCKACVHNDKGLYDHTVIKDQHELRTERDLEEFFDKHAKTGLDIANLKQIAIVTGLFGNEDEVINHLTDVTNVAKKRGFSGEIMYFGCQVTSNNALRKMADLGKTAIVFAIDNFTARTSKMSPVKYRLSLDKLKEVMSNARQVGIETSFAYIVGVDDLESLEDGFKMFAPVCTRFPVVNIFQIQSELQVLAMHDSAKNLEYYIKARLAIEKAFRHTNYRPKRWENYRPLWYETFSDEQLFVKPYGD